MSGVLREDNRHRKRLLFGCRRALPEHGRPRPCERLPKDEVPKGGWSEAELRQRPPATIASLDNAPQSTKNANKPELSVDPSLRPPT